MIFHEFGNTDAPLFILIHGMMTPWQIMLPLKDCLSENYHFIIPALDGHTSEEKSEFLSIDDEARKIEEYILTNYQNKVSAVCGLSLGGAVAYSLWKRKGLIIENLILDGAPLISCGKLSARLMHNQYSKILAKSKARDNATLKSFSKNFLPSKYLPDYLSFIDNMSAESVENIMESLNKGCFDKSIPAGDTKILYLHGTSLNEILSKRTARKIAKHLPSAYVVTLKGDSHCQCAIYEPSDWSQAVINFIYKTEKI